MNKWEHDHSFGQDKKKPGEFRTLIVIAMTFTTMILEIVAGIIYGSMALLADGLHMASHASALMISMIAYVYARRYAHDKRFSFGTGKVNSLAGFTGAILLAAFALVMAWESVGRLFAPLPIAFNQALMVAVFGLVVNGLSVLVLGHDHGHHHDHEHHDEHAHDHSHHHEHDHNLRSAYLHVLADALTSVLAIFALLAGKYYALNWLDPVMGIVGAVLVARWSYGLLKMTIAVLLDHQGPQELQELIRRNIADIQGADVVDLHLWQIGPGMYSLIMSIATSDPLEVQLYKQAIPQDSGIVHITVEVHQDHNVSSQTG
ncbi:Cadmium, cobalt and zinc/H(+)-K(+) antiporter [Novipirellula aureliae]|uniref:Cadmium, cobalt and zinc/H(+)-K(+) antiporter n=1 Tax=Novipirellula aureliae TaxID=2527966 RepID=A0A5C6DV84_9BACT|nr:CDF family Co(II)/Ni(II) efflux transporter DmeF [Novipirellula aureliae]TWU39867.1 Cadmium, cobalt and zinc/H(+)-K(+) antiporter [Novipirellula aureliae]